MKRQIVCATIGMYENLAIALCQQRQSRTGGGRSRRICKSEFVINWTHRTKTSTKTTVDTTNNNANSIDKIVIVVIIVNSSVSQQQAEQQSVHCGDAFKDVTEKGEDTDSNGDGKKTTREEETREKET